MSQTMGLPPPLVSPVTGSDVASQPFYLHADDSNGHFRDVHGRCVLLRGINLASSAKTPRGQPGQQLEGFWESAESGDVTFVNRVLDLSVSPDDENSADEHLRRLKGWGFNVLRYVTTWESIEHAGPGLYDQDYIEYTIRLLRKCKAHGFYVYMDPHQDLWSRFSGGCGAPYWTLPACGLNPRNFTITNAAVIQCEWPGPDHPDPEHFPDMIWASNYSRLAVSTLMTLFFSGKRFAPLCEIDGVNIEEYLQKHYFEAYRHLANAIRDAGDLNDSCVVGWDSLNEPNHGFAGLDSVTVQPSSNVCKIGPMPTAFEAMKLGMGFATDVESWKFGSLGPKKEGMVRIDPRGAKVWLDEAANLEYSARYGWKRSTSWPTDSCVWALHGVWDIDSHEVVNDDYFSAARTGFTYKRDGWQKFWMRWASMIRESHAEAIHFALPPVFEVPPSFKEDAECVTAISKRAALSVHFYDGLTLITKHWNWYNADALGILRGKYSSIASAIRVGQAAIRRCMRDQIGYLRQDTFDSMGLYPTMMGEIGIPYDLDKRKAYESGDYDKQSQALDASMNACDGKNLLNYTIWTYNPENTHQWGENWNGEDLSVWSLDDIGRVCKPSWGTSDEVISASSSTSGLVQSFQKEACRPSRDLDAGARAMEAFIRPFPRAVAGVPTFMELNIKTSRFLLEIDRVPEMLRKGSEEIPTEIFVPYIHYGRWSPVDDSPQAYKDTAKSEVQLHSTKARSQTEAQVAHKGDTLHACRSSVVSVDVFLSHGRFETEGQILKWYHEPCDKPTKERIIITRRDGPGKRTVHANGGNQPSFTETVYHNLWVCLSGSGEF